MLARISKITLTRTSALSYTVFNLQSNSKNLKNSSIQPTIHTNLLSRSIHYSPYNLHKKQQFDRAGTGYLDKNGNWQWHKEHRDNSKNIGLKFVAWFIFMTGIAVASEPLYRAFCTETGRGGLSTDLSGYTDTVEKMKVVRERPLRVHFTASKSSLLEWNFKPEQDHVDLFPGETALIFYKAKNPTDKHVIGVSTYTIEPYESGAYFNKIQCFCFEQQMLGPHEEVDLPVFFFIDPELDEDPLLSRVFDIQLCYTFFEVKEGDELPLPGFPMHAKI